MLIIEEFFLLVDDNTPDYKIETAFNNSNPNIPIFGIKITRQLFNGYIHIDIYGQGQDDDTVTLKYYHNQNTVKPIKALMIESKMYCDNSVREAVKTILKLDKNHELSQECSC